MCKLSKESSHFVENLGFIPPFVETSKKERKNKKNVLKKCNSTCDLPPKKKLKSDEQMSTQTTNQSLVSTSNNDEINNEGSTKNSSKSQTSDISFTKIQTPMSNFSTNDQKYDLENEIFLTDYYISDEENHQDLNKEIIITELNKMNQKNQANSAENQFDFLDLGDENSLNWLEKREFCFDKLFDDEEKMMLGFLYIEFWNSIKLKIIL